MESSVCSLYSGSWYSIIQLFWDGSSEVNGRWRCFSRGDIISFLLILIIFFCIPKILRVTLRSEWDHPTNRQNLDYNSESWHKWGEQPQAELEWMGVASSALHHPDHSQGRRGSYDGCRPAFPSEYNVLLAHTSSFIQTLGNMVGSSEWGEFREEVICHDEKWERIKRFE